MLRSSAKRGGLVALVIAMGLVGGTAGAATTPSNSNGDSDTGSNNTSATNVQTAVPSLRDRLEVTFWSSFHGPAVTTPGDSYSPKEEGGRGDTPLFFESLLGFGYKVNKSVTAGITVPFDYQPVLGQGLTFHELYLRVNHSKVIDSNGWNLQIDGRASLPTTQKAQDQGMITALRSTQVLNYTIPNSRWTVGTYSFARGYFLLSANANKDKDWDVYLAPNANFQIIPTFALTGWVDLLSAKHLVAAPSGDLVFDPVTAEVGFNWDITPNLSINPQVMFYPANFSLDNSSLGAIISAKLL